MELHQPIHLTISPPSPTTTIITTTTTTISIKVFANGYVALVKKMHHHRFTADHDGSDLEVVVTGDADNPMRFGLGIPVVVVGE